MSQLSKKERKYYSKLITQKLMSMGVKDEITFTSAGKKRFYRKNSDGTLETHTVDGKVVPKVFEIDRHIALNVLRRTVREMRRQSYETVDAFLNLSSNNTSNS